MKLRQRERKRNDTKLHELITGGYSWSRLEPTVWILFEWEWISSALEYVRWSIVGYVQVNYRRPLRPTPSISLDALASSTVRHQVQPERGKLPSESLATIYLVEINTSPPQMDTTILIASTMAMQ